MLTLLAAFQSLALLMSAAEPRLPGFEVMTPADDSSLAPGTVYMRYSGPIDSPLADILADAWAANRQNATELIFEIDSFGGPVNHAAEVIATLQVIRQQVELVTVVGAGGVCASACVPVYMQGEIRKAHPASAWMFHAALSVSHGEVSSGATQWVTDALRASGIAPSFLDDLRHRGYLSEPGEFWLSGYELEIVYHAQVITQLLPNWTPAAPHQPPFDPSMGHR